MDAELAKKHLLQIRYTSSQDGRQQALPEHVVEAIAPLIVTLTRLERERCLAAIQGFHHGDACRARIEGLSD